MSLRTTRRGDAAAALGLAALLGAVACAGAPAPAPAPVAAPAPHTAGSATPSARRFPSPAQLADLSRAPAPEDLFALDVSDVDRWELAGPFPARVEATPYTQPTPWGALLAAEAGHRAGLVLPTEAMHCLAREIGRFYLAHRARPGEALRRFMVGRCHASVGSVALSTLHAEVPAALDDAALFERWRESLAGMLRDRAVGGPRTAGVWFGRRSAGAPGGSAETDLAVAVVAFGVREVLVEPLDTALVPDGAFEIRGEVLTPTARVAALIGRGAYGFAECLPSPDVALPRFEFACRADPADARARVSLDLVPSGRFLSRPALDLVVWPRGAPNASWERLSYHAPRRASDADSAAQRLVEMVNHVRARAGLAPLELEREQSAVAAQLAPHFFASFFGRREEPLADLVALGMLAGWSVDGIVQSGRFTASWVGQSDDLDRLLSTALTFPLGRQTLLDPDSDRIAVGAVVSGDPERPSLAAVFGTYALFSEAAHDAHVQQVFARLRALRAERGLPPPEPLAGLATLSMEASSRVQGGGEPRDVFEELLSRSQEELQRPVSGWITEVPALEELAFPEDFLARPVLSVAVGVCYRRPAGEPWGRYVVMMVAASTERRQL